MDILDLIFRARTAELDQAEKKLDAIGNKAEKAEKKSKGLSDSLGGFGKLGGPVGDVANKISDVSDKAEIAVGSFGRLGGGITLIGTAAAAAVAGAVALTLKVVDMADALNDLSNRSNVSTERLSLLDAMAKMAGSSVEELVTSSEKLGMKLAKQDEESGKAVTALKSLGISTRDASGELKSMLTLQEEIVLAADAATDKAKAEGAAVMLLGTNYYSLRTAIKETAEQKSEMYDYMQKVGSVVTTKLAKDSDALNDKIGKLGLSFKGMGISIASAVLPYLNSLLDKFIAISEKAADIIRRFSGGSTASEMSGDALSKLQKERENAMATIKKIEGTAYADTAQGAKALEQARAQVTVINDQIREMGRLKVAADSAAASVKAAVTDGKPTEGNKVTGTPAKPDTPKKVDPLAWMKEPEYVAALSKAQTLANEKNKDYNYATEQGIANSISYQEQLRKQATAFQEQADAVRDMLDPSRELSREIEAINKNPLLNDDEKGAAIVGLSLKWEESMGRMKDSTRELTEFANASFDMLGQAISDMVFDADFNFKDLARSFIKMAFDMLVVQPMIESLKKTLTGLANSSSGSGGGGFWGTIINALTTVGTGKASGGVVSSGRMYPVNERGPELLNVGSKQFLMMGSQTGYVSPNRGSSSAAQGAPQINVGGIHVTVKGGENAERDGQLAGIAAQKAFMEKIADARIHNALRYGNALNR